MNSLNFIKVAIKDYKVGAITISSRYTVQQVMRELGSQHKYIIEYGAGDGVITKEILKVLPADGKLIAVEINHDFLRELRKIKDPRLIVTDEDIIKLSQNFNQFSLPRIDAIISGIPFTFLKPKKRKTLIANTHLALAKGGIFIVYQVSPLVFPLLKKYFTNVRLRFEPRNIPPYFIMRAEKIDKI